MKCLIPAVVCCCYWFVYFTSPCWGSWKSSIIVFFGWEGRTLPLYMYLRNTTCQTMCELWANCLHPSQTQPSGLLEDYPSGVDPDAECCDVRWDLKVDNRSRGTLKRTHPPCQHRTSLSSSAACRLCNSRLKLCLLVLVLLHTVASLTASHNATGLGLPTITPLEESPANEEWYSCQEEVRLLRWGIPSPWQPMWKNTGTGAVVPVDIICSAFWQMENVGRFETKDTQINQNK